MTRLSVNLNKVALLRNSGGDGTPSLTEAAKMVLEGGAQGITVGLHPQGVQPSDIPALAAFIAECNSPFPSFMMKEEQRGDVHFTIEGYPDDDFLTLAAAHKCDQVTLLPQRSSGGWDIPTHRELLKDAIQTLRKARCRVVLPVDPAPVMAEHAAELGASRIMLCTMPYAKNNGALPDYIRTVESAHKAAIGINAGGALDLGNLGRFVADVPDCSEITVGHALTADALSMGWRSAVAAYLAAITYGKRSAKVA